MAMGGLGTKVQLTDGVHDVALATALAKATKIKTPKTTTKDINYTPLSNGSDVHALHTPGSDDSDALTFELPYSTADFATLKAAQTTINAAMRAGGSAGAAVVAFPDATGFTGVGTEGGPVYISEVSKSEATADALATISVTAQPTDAWTIGS